jgi:hypothetical protein
MKPFSLAGPFFALLPKDGNCELLNTKGAIPISDFQVQSAAMRAAVAKAHKWLDLEEQKLTGGGHF